LGILVGTLVAALNVALSIWAVRYTLRGEPTIHGLAARVRWYMVAVGVVVAAAGVALWPRSLFGDQVSFVGLSLSAMFLIFRSLSLQLVTLWDRIAARHRR
jgi:hypothetical protein